MSSSNSVLSTKSQVHFWKKCGLPGGLYMRHARSTSPSTSTTITSSPTALRASRTGSWTYAHRRARLRQALQDSASPSTRSVKVLCYLRPYRLRRESALWQFLLLFGASHVQTCRPRLPDIGYVLGQRKAAGPVELRMAWVSYAKCDRKCTAHVSTGTIELCTERVSHHIRRLLSARACMPPNVCLRRLLTGSESHLTVA